MNFKGLDIFYLSMSILLLAIVLMSLPTMLEHSRRSKASR